jgi:hypothetical protein
VTAGDPDRIHWPDLVQEGISARRDRDGAQWRLGDLALEVETSYGGGELERYAEEIGLEYDTLRRYRDVSRAYVFATRVANLSFSHHRQVAARPDRLEWLQRADAGGWSVRRLQEAAPALEAGAGSLDSAAIDDLAILYGQLLRRGHLEAAVALAPELTRRLKAEIAELRRRTAALREAAS